MRLGEIRSEAGAHRRADATLSSTRTTEETGAIKIKGKKVCVPFFFVPFFLFFPFFCFFASLKEREIDDRGRLQQD